MTENLKTSFKWTYVRYFGSLFCYNRYTLTFSPKEYINFDMQSRSSFVRHISGKVTFPLLDKFNDTLLSLSLEVHVYMRFLIPQIVLSSLLRLIQYYLMVKISFTWKLSIFTDLYETSKLMSMVSVFLTKHTIHN